MKATTIEKPTEIDAESLFSMNKRVPSPERIAYVKSCFEYLINHKDSTSVKFLHKVNEKKYMFYPSGGMHGDSTKKRHRIWVVLTIADPPKPKKVISFDEKFPHGRTVNRELFGVYSHRLSNKSWFCLRLEGCEDGTYRVVEGKSRFKIIKSANKLKLSDEILENLKQSSDLKYYHGEADEEIEALQRFEQCVEFIINNPELPINILKPVDEDTFMKYPNGGLRPKGRKTNQVKHFLAYIRLLHSNCKSQKADPLISFIGDLGDGKQEHFLEGTFTDKLTVPNHKVVIQLKRVDGVYYVDRYRVLQGIRREGDKLFLMPIDSIPRVKRNLRDDMQTMLGMITGVPSDNHAAQKKRQRDLQIEEPSPENLPDDAEPSILYVDVLVELVSKTIIPSDHKILHKGRRCRMWVEITDGVTAYRVKFTSPAENRSWFSYLTPIKIHRPGTNKYLLETIDEWTQFKIVECIPSSKPKKHRQAADQAASD